MRIAFVGKGGSGKTTLSSLFVRHLQTEGKPVFAIDADINQHLRDAIGVGVAPQKRLGHEQKRLKENFAGSNPLIDPACMIKTTPPGRGSAVHLGLESLLDALDGFVVREGTLAFSEVGQQTEEDVGMRCYHSKTGAVELVLNHLVDGKDEYVVVDMTAGADAFASGLFDKFDLTVIAVEPTMKSVGVFRQYAEQAKALGVSVAAVGNKVVDKEDIRFLNETLGDDLIGAMPVSSFVKGWERGDRKSFSELEENELAVLAGIKAALDVQKKDWERYHLRSVEIHRKNARGWANESVGVDLEKQIDTEFRYPVS